MFTKLIKEFPKAFAISLCIFFSIVLVKYLMGLTITLDVSLAINFGYSMLYGLSLYYANALVFIYLDSVYKETRFSVQRLIVGFVSTFFVTLFVIFLLTLLRLVCSLGGNLYLDW